MQPRAMLAHLAGMHLVGMLGQFLDVAQLTQAARQLGITLQRIEQFVLFLGTKLVVQVGIEQLFRDILVFVCFHFTLLSLGSVFSSRWNSTRLVRSACLARQTRLMTVPIGTSSTSLTSL